MNEHEDIIELQLTETAARILRNSVTVAIRYWPGGDPEEQENMKYMESLLNSVLLEFTYENS